MGISSTRSFTSSIHPHRARFPLFVLDIPYELDSIFRARHPLRARFTIELDFCFSRSASFTSSIHNRARFPYIALGILSELGFESSSVFIYRARIRQSAYRIRNDVIRKFLSLSTKKNPISQNIGKSRNARNLVIFLCSPLLLTS